MTRQEYVAALRTLADFYEAHDLPHPCAFDECVEVNAVGTREELATVARAAAPLDKVVGERYFALRKRLPGVQIDFFNVRELVCTRRVVGKKVEVEKIPTAFEEREVEREIVEWDCPPLLAGKA